MAGAKDEQALVMRAALLRPPVKQGNSKTKQCRVGAEVGGLRSSVPGRQVVESWARKWGGYPPLFLRVAAGKARRICATLTKKSSECSLYMLVDLILNLLGVWFNFPRAVLFR